MSTQKHWFVIRTFEADVFRFREEIEATGREVWVPTRSWTRKVDGEAGQVQIPLIPQILFVRCTEEGLRSYMQGHVGELGFYLAEDGQPLTVSDGDMDNFMRADAARETENLNFMGLDAQRLALSDRVTVAGGRFSGIQGYFKKVGHDRAVLLDMPRVAVIKLHFIDLRYLKRV